MPKQYILSNIIIYLFTLTLVLLFRTTEHLCYVLTLKPQQTACLLRACYNTKDFKSEYYGTNCAFHSLEVMLQISTDYSRC